QDLSTGKAGPLAVAAGDFTGDGLPEVAIINNSPGNISVFANTTVTITNAQAVGTIIDDDPTGNQPPVLAAIPNQTVPSSQQAVTVSLSASDPDGDPVTFSATAQSLAYVLAGQYGPFTHSPDSDNWGGLGEKWFTGAGGAWFFLL